MPFLSYLFNDILFFGCYLFTTFITATLVIRTSLPLAFVYFCFFSLLPHLHLGYSKQFSTRLETATMYSSKWLVISVTGITSGGKSELCTFLHKNLPNTSRLLRQDDYFLPKDSPKHVKCPGGIDHLNWDIINCIDMDKMFKDVRTVLDNPPSARREEISYTNMAVADDVNTKAKTIGVWNQKRVAVEKEAQGNGDGITPRATSELNKHSEEATPNVDLVVGAGETTNAEGSDGGNSRPVLILDGFTLLDDPRFIEISDQVFFFYLTKEECFRRRELRCFDPPDVPGYFDQCVYPMFDHYKTRCETEYAEKIEVLFRDGAGQQKVIHEEILGKVKKAASLT